MGCPLARWTAGAGGDATPTAAAIHIRVAKVGMLTVRIYLTDRLERIPPVTYGETTTFLTALRTPCCSRTKYIPGRIRSPSPRLRE